ncbi:ABC transporter ATP-binding protein [Gottschalkia acidurici 9a]|uniref:ABC transporter ATP-binding protein n=1 Tax=Gottschalkia acidurici (strain ATCC 7906 / DSM 604 / BCRC 14475 / CIP 104303 / KCTC 5404 / NCIMB 10678 / 9a) TaxID=1128398 RepID=K0B019_GOTA9|nr:ABC transporter ATP-binding protein [Gottschalkia acidurici]AFS78874.1 ABC transporter ATP-binding protein [Gottschalkia acidurici 9a]
MIKLFRFLKSYRIPIAVVFILVFFQSLSELYLPTLMSDIVNTGIVKGDTQYILKIGRFMLLVALGGTICTVVANLLSSRIGVGFSTILRKEIFSKVEGFSLNEIDKVGTSSLITRTTNDINQIQQVVIITLRIIIGAPMMCIGGIIMAVSKDARLTLIFLAAIPLLGLVIGLIISRGAPFFKIMQVKIDNLNLVLRENLMGIRVIRAFNRIDYEKKRFNNANHDLTDTAIRVNKIMAGMMPSIMLIMNITTIAIIWFGSIRIDNGSMKVGDMMAFLQYAMQIMFSLVMTTMMFVLVPRASASAIRINEVLDMTSDIKDNPDAQNTDSKRGYVEFKNVIFSFPGAEKPALSNISFSTKPGEVTAIIGGTGSGKSALINLIMRFYDIDSGEILVNGKNIKSLSQKYLRSRIGLVPQKAVLFTGTIEDNIRYGKEDATEEEIKHAADVAQASDFIANMKDGFKSLISQGGTNVSGGQKQRLSIARSLVRKPDIYIFDDSFSALDFKTDAKLRKALKKETKNSTMIVVAQRVSTVMDADRIIVLDDGKIKGIGTHKELLRDCGIYQEIVYSQLSKEEV